VTGKLRDLVFVVADKAMQQMLEGFFGRDQFHRRQVVVLDPEIETWFWQPDSRHIAAALDYRGDKPYRQVLAEAGHWPADQVKPPRPKEAREYLRKHYRTDPSNAVFKRAGSTISISGCTDPAFHLLCQPLRRWFPVEA
jgi:hypothetical protein